MQIQLLLMLRIAHLLQCIHMRHDYWFTEFRKAAESRIAHKDVAWNYCDYKCVYLETMYPGIDFFVINFENQLYLPSLSACYAQKDGDTQLWNQYIQNVFYQQICGTDTDYRLNPKYRVISQEGVGIGTQITY